MDLLTIFRLLSRHSILIAACCVAGAVAMLGAAIMLGPRYEVNAKLLVQLGREMLPSPTVGSKEAGQVMPVTLRPEDSASEIEILTDPNLMRQVVGSFDPAFFLAEPPAVTLLQQLKRIPRATLALVSDGLREALVGLGLRPATTPLDRVTLGLMAGLDIEPVHKTDVISLKLTVADPQAGVALLDRFISVALTSHTRAHHVAREHDFLMQERAARNADLGTAQAALLNIRNARFAAWLGSEQRSVLLKAVADLTLQNAQASADAAQTAAEIESMQPVLETLPQAVQTSSVQTRNRLGDDLNGRLVQLQIDLAGLRRHYASGSPDIAETLQQIDTVQGLLAGQPSYQAAEVTTGTNPVRDELARQLLARQHQLAGQRARAEQLATQLDQFQQQLRSVQAAEIEVDRLEREIARLHRLVDLYDGSIDEARVSDAMQAADISAVKVIMPATADIMPVGPSLKRFLLLGVAGGLVLAIATILSREYAGQGRRSGVPPEPARARPGIAGREARG